MAKMVQFGDFEKPEACGQTVLPKQGNFLIGQKIGGKCQNVTF